MPSPTDPDRARGGFFAPGPPRVLAHRGLAVEERENTMPAFAAALDAGARYLETDVQLSRDQVAVLSHDADLLRVFGRSERIADLSARELAGLGGGGIPALADALEAFPDARFNIDVKADGASWPAARAVRASGAAGRVLITSFSERRRADAVRLLPGVATSASRRGVALALAAAASGSRRAMRAATAGIDALQVPVRYGALEVVTPRLVRAAHEAGVEVHVWTVDEPSEMRRLRELGVDGIITDRCDVALAVLAGQG